MKMSLINCSKEKYLKALAERMPTKAEAEILKKAAEDAKILHLKDGRQIAPRFWLQALRAHMRGRLALSRLASSTCKCLCSAAMDDALSSQGLLLSRLMRECPDFFADMLDVPLDAVLEPEQATG
jgi:hypothetical protein